MAEQKTSNLVKIAAVLLAVLVSEPSLAQTPAEVAREWGLLGSWRTDCSAPASRSNIEITYAVRGGKVFYDRDLGNSRDSNPVVSAALTADGAIDMVIAFAAFSQNRRNVLYKAPDGSRYRTLVSVNIDTAEYSIKGGRFTVNGSDAPWVSRCR